MSNLYTDRVVRNITPLDNLEKYEALSDSQRSDRYLQLLDHQLSKATYLSNKVKKPNTFITDQLADMADIAGSLYSTESHETKQKELLLSRNIARFEPFCATALKRLVSFSVTPGTFESVYDEELEQVLRFWYENLTAMDAAPGFVKQIPGLKIFEESFVRELLVDGDLVISESWSKVSVPIYRVTPKGKRTVKFKNFLLPTRLAIHDFSSLKVKEVSSLYNREIITMKVPEDLKELAGKSELTHDEKQTLDQLPDYIKKQLKGEGSSEYISLVDPKGKESFVTHIKLHGNSYALYGKSFFASAFEPISRKYRLRELDEATITGIINRVTIIKAGLVSLEGQTTITPNRLQMLEQLLSEPKVNELILWPGDDISIEDIGPQGKILEFDKRYDHVNSDILAAIGVPRVLIDGKSEMSGERTVYASFLGLKEFLEQDIRNDRLIPFVESLARGIATKNNFKAEYPKYQKGRINLQDPEMLLNRAKFEYDRGLMSERTAITDGGRTWEIERQRREFESINGIVHNFGIPDLAFNEPSDRGDSGPKEDTEKISDPDEVSDTGSNAAFAASTRDANYAEDLDDIYQSNTSKILTRMENSGIPNSTIIGSLIVMFGLLKKSSREYVNESYNKLLEDANYYDVELLDNVISWSDQQFDNWLDSMTETITSKITDELDTDDKVILLAGIFSAAINTRLYKYETAIPSKVERAVSISASKAGGNEYATWISALTENTCAYCTSLHGKSMSIDAALEMYPVHPSCQCDYLEHKTLPKNADTDIPEKDSDNWSNLK